MTIVSFPCAWQRWLRLAVTFQIADDESAPGIGRCAGDFHSDQRPE